MRYPRFLLSSLCACALFLPASGWAALRVAGLFADGAVLQRARPVPVWGWADAGAEVRVSFGAAEAKTKVGADGRWTAVLPAMPAQTRGAFLTVSSAGEQLKIKDVVVGEVWLCSGQSNMEWLVSQSENADKEIAAANFPLIRQFRVPKLPAETPQADVTAEWTPAVPAQVGGFTGVGYFFARDIHRALDGVPVGLINASWGGKMIEVFMPPAAVARTPHVAAVEHRWQAEVREMTERQKTYPQALAEWSAARDEAKKRGGKFSRAKPQDPAGILAQHRPACAFNGMIAPLVPYALRGVLWYQGEHNISRAGEYRAMFGAMIADWRERFGQGKLPFYFAQLSSFSAPMDKSRTGFAELREAQAQTLAVPATGMAVTIDIGTPDNVHPRKKQDVGVRLARVAKAKTYGLGGEWSGPVLRTVERTPAGVKLSFDHAAGSLQSRREPLPGFETAGDDGVFRPATARIEGEAVILAVTDSATVRAVRYAWANAPENSLFNSQGLPAAPFRTPIP